MKTIRQIAEELGVSKQAVYKRYKGKLHKTVSPHARIIGNTTYISQQGESIIKQGFLHDSAYNGTRTEYTQNTLILTLQKELEIKNNQIAELTAVIKLQIESPVKTYSRKYYPDKKPIKPKKTSPPIIRLSAKHAEL
jgi:predicted transcriptional regulator